MAAGPGQAPFERGELGLEVGFRHQVGVGLADGSDDLLGMLRLDAGSLGVPDRSWVSIVMAMGGFYLLPPGGAARRTGCRWRSPRGFRTGAPAVGWARPTPRAGGFRVGGVGVRAGRFASSARAAPVTAGRAQASAERAFCTADFRSPPATTNTPVTARMRAILDGLEPRLI